MNFFVYFLTDPQAVKKAFSALMTSSPDVVSVQLNKLLKRIMDKKSSGHDVSADCGELLLRLNSQFPGDVGCFCIYFLNHIVLKPGEAMFLGPNLPHAYLAGGERYLFNFLSSRWQFSLLISVNFSDISSDNSITHHIIINQRCPISCSFP